MLNTRLEKGRFPGIAVQPRGGRTGLNMGTIYYYQITVDGTSASGAFQTPPDPASTSLTFYGYGDIRGQEWMTDTSYTMHDTVERQIMMDMRQEPRSQERQSA